MVEEGKYATAKRKREEHVNAVLNSPANKKIVVAGPGTGKTYLFERILKGKKKTLTLTFVNALVEDLSLEFCGLSEVKTLHSFALDIMNQAMNEATQKDIKIFPKLTEVIKEDAKILLNEEIDFEHLFHNKTAEEKHTEFYKRRKKYYEGRYGFSDIMFAAVRLLEEKKDKIPMFDQVLVDEFQDFNKSEVALIDLLAEKSPVLIVGDDDQALYEFKSASPEHIRQRYSESTSGYATFSLPYCSRCTRVIVDATTDIINSATKRGHLSKRINKPFRHFDDEEKNRHSDENPHIIYRQLQAAQIPFYIQKHIEEIAKEVRGKFTVLIICPTNTQCRTVVDALKNKGFESVHFAEKKERKEPTLLDGLKLLLEDSNSNLGWRIVAAKVLKDIDFENILKDTDKDDAQRFSDLIKADDKKEVNKMLKTLRAVRDGRQTEDTTEHETEFAKLLKKVGVDAYEMARDYLKYEIKSYKPIGWKPSFCSPEVRKIPINTTTIQSSKGLDADYVFITYFDDKYFIKDEDKGKISDQDICSFVVALTRATRKVFLFSSDTTKRPLFLSWIDKKRIKEIKTKDKS